MLLAGGLVGASISIWNGSSGSEGVTGRIVVGVLAESMSMKELGRAKTGSPR